MQLKSESNPSNASPTEALVTALVAKVKHVLVEDRAFLVVREARPLTLSLLLSLAVPGIEYFEAIKAARFHAVALRRSGQV